MGERWGIEHEIPVDYFPANWGDYGKSAGMIRNAEMAKYADALILIWDGKSNGSKNMLEQAKKKGMPIYDVIVNENSQP